MGPHFTTWDLEIFITLNFRDLLAMHQTHVINNLYDFVMGMTKMWNGLENGLADGLTELT